MKVKWKGTAKMLRVLSNAPNRVDELRQAVIKNNTELAKKKAQELAPRDTGFLKTQIKSSYPQKGVGQIDDGASYAGYQEYGTRYQPGKPHLRPAIDYVTPKLKKDLEDVLKGAFK